MGFRKIFLHIIFVFFLTSVTFGYKKSFSIEYRIFLDDSNSHTFQVKFDYTDYPNYIYIISLIKPNKGTTLNKQIYFTENTILKNNTLLKFKSVFTQNKLNVFGFGEVYDADIKISRKVNEKETMTNFSRPDNFYTIGSFFFNLVENGISEGENYHIFLDGSVSKVTVSNLPGDKFLVMGEDINGYLSFQDVSGIKVPFAFEISNVTIGKISNAVVKGKVSDIKFSRT